MVLLCFEARVHLAQCGDDRAERDDDRFPGSWRAGVCGLLIVCPSVAVAEHEGHETLICHDEQITLGDLIGDSSIVATLSYRATARCTPLKNGDRPTCAG